MARGRNHHHRWAVMERKPKGVSVGGVYARNYEHALERAAAIGFKNPDSVALDTTGEIQARWRKIAGYK